MSVYIVRPMRPKYPYARSHCGTLIHRIRGLKGYYREYDGGFDHGIIEIACGQGHLQGARSTIGTAEQLMCNGGSLCRKCQRAAGQR